MRVSAFVYAVVVLSVFLFPYVDALTSVLYHNQRTFGSGPDAGVLGRNTRAITTSQGSLAGVSLSSNQVTLSIAGTYLIRVNDAIDNSPSDHRLVLHDTENDVDLFVGPVAITSVAAVLTTLVTVPILGSVTFSVIHDIAGTEACYFGDTAAYTSTGLTHPTNDVFMTMSIELV